MTTRRLSPKVVAVAIFDSELRKKAGTRATKCPKFLPDVRLARKKGYKREEPGW